jgi:hypothetical protein
MGGIVRSIFGGRSKAPAAPAVVQAAAQPAAQATVTAQPTGPAIGSGYGGRRSTVMTGAAGLEGEANVARTVLGGGSRTERRKMI